MSLVVEMRVAVEAVLVASRLCQSVFKTLVLGESLAKDDKSPVTVADFGAQAVVNALLLKHFPDDPIVGEEDSKDLKSNTALSGRVLGLVNGVMESKMTTEQMFNNIDRGNYVGGRTGRFWTLDPIDGTKGFLRGDQYAVCLALIVDGTVELGVLGCPNLPHDLSKPDGECGSILVATRGDGAFQRSLTSDIMTRISTTRVENPAETRLCEGIEPLHSSHATNGQIMAHLLQNSNNHSPTNIRMDSQCKYALVARGDAGIYLRVPVSSTYQEKIWDHAAGKLIVEEAGGRVTDILGRELDFGSGRTLKENEGILATGGTVLYDKVYAAVKSVVKS
ncbi:hypothetical protein HK100_003402 [Physocladia obscura]|uniref:3'(2'),5'-bisphosphate nucleotidase n=1 Tax=Physocladia obscura TaxID=109957 RepID=A0AAD5SVR9_9FUNG|nr:hypothetical protein HK100_003402 [Physocladia obscura]